MHNVHLLEVVGRGSETQLQVSENLNNSRNEFNLCAYSDNIERRIA